MENLGVFGSAVVLAVIVEAVLEYVLGTWFVPLKEGARAKVLMAVGLVIGIGLCLNYKVDLLAEMGLEAGWLGQVLTGVIIGRGSEYLHAFYKRLKPVPPIPSPPAIPGTPSIPTPPR